MKRILISPNNYFIQPNKKNNVYIQDSDTSHAAQQHADLVSLLHDTIVFQLPLNRKLRDSVFVANGGLSLWGVPACILSNMKFAHRKEELPYMEKILHDMKIKTIHFPSETIFEGQGECCWFHDGSILLCGYGYRNTRRTCDELEALLHKVYRHYGKTPPQVIPVKIENPYFYHLDFAVFKFSETECILHPKAFSKKTIQLLYDVLGKENVHCIRTSDTICLNSIRQGNTIITGIVPSYVKKQMEDITGLSVHQVEVNHFEKSGGSVRCMILDIYNGSIKN